MDLREAIRNRRSVRAFRPEPVPEEAIRELLALAAWAPSAGNLQSRDFVVVRDEARRRALAAAALDQDFVAQAPAVVVVCANARRVEGKYGRRGRELYMVQDAAASTQNLLLAAHDAGLGACWVGAFDEDAVRKILGLTAGIRPVAIIPIGRPAEPSEPSDRLSLDDVVHWEQW